ncbi:MAG: 3-isopropylmalate dehydratase [Pseudobutyrivibrio sp.]|nr:3-isopropylmalate dehydratase [Pseudobutyrivibrio sp.]
MFKAKIWKLGDDIDTDIILPTEYLAYETVEDMKPYAFSPLRPELAAKIQPGDMIVAGHNFGCGSSREQAPEVVKALGISCIVAKSYARIFFRNAINNGLLLIEQPDLYDEVKEGDVAEVETGKEIKVNGKSYPIASLPDNLLEILEAGGLVKAMRKKNGLD